MIWEWLGQAFPPLLAVFPPQALCHLGNSRLHIPGISRIFDNLECRHCLCERDSPAVSPHVPCSGLTAEETEAGETSTLWRVVITPKGKLGKQVHFFLSFFLSHFWLFQQPNTPATRDGGAMGEGRRRREIEREESEGWNGGMQRWKRAVVISSFGGEQIIKHFLKPISALMYVCVRARLHMCVCVRGGECNLYFLSFSHERSQICLQVESHASWQQYLHIFMTYC